MIVDVEGLSERSVWKPEAHTTLRRLEEVLPFVLYWAWHRI